MSGLSGARRHQPDKIPIKLKGDDMKKITLPPYPRCGGPIVYDRADGEFECLLCNHPLKKELDTSLLIAERNKHNGNIGVAYHVKHQGQEAHPERRKPAFTAGRRKE